MKPALDELLRHPGVWRAHGGREASPVARRVASGDPALDAWLPNGGWPSGALTELLCEHRGIGELGLLTPLLARLTGNDERVALVAPPLLPYAPALVAAGLQLQQLLLVRPRLPAEAFWAAEQLLRSAVFGAVVLWMSGDAPVHTLRRLQLAAEHGDASAFVFRLPARRGPDARRDDGRVSSASASEARSASPAALRLRVTPCGERVRAVARGGRRPRLVLGVLKCRGRPPATPLAL